MGNTMKAVVFSKLGEIRLEERPVPVIRHPKDAIVRVTMAAICSSDIHIKHGMIARAKEGVILGHEIVGEVVETGPDVCKLKKGDRVTVNNETFCGECFYCKRGYVNNCVNGGWMLGCVEDGGQAEYVRVAYADNCCDLIPDGVSDEQAMLVGDVLATGFWAAEIGELHPGDTAVVLGAGPTGLCTSICARLYSPARLISVDISDERLAFAKRHGYADITINSSREDVEEIVKSLTDGRGADRLFECAGGKNTFGMAWQTTRPSGIVCLVAHYEEDPQKLPLRRMYGKNLVFKTGGVHANACAKTLDLIKEGKLDTAPLITHRYALKDALEGYRLFENQEDGVIKVVLTP
ncbi:alcohol dehydrogenase [Clostridium sp. Marseille-P3244]|uniref:alcohol dehydrogenase n=1 Tax=Clostridium sp. Marseille-P3244 TaxID=1871020 RepID=UPI000ACEB00E|nr:alcohol dehydrogenase [Clostridium sp. Marseille-P3244]